MVLAWFATSLGRLHWLSNLSIALEVRAMPVGVNALLLHPTDALNGDSDSVD